MTVEPRTRPPAPPALDAPAVTLGQIFEHLYGPDVPIRFEAYDGSRAGDPEATITVRMVSPRAVSYLITAPGSLGLARAYLQGDLEIDGVHPGDPYELLRIIDGLTLRRPSPAVALQWLRGLGLATLKPPPLPDLEQVPARRLGIGLRHSRKRDATAISYHYDVSNDFYELVLGPSMTYTCACYPTEDSTLEQAQEHKYDLVARKLGLTRGDAVARRRLRLGRDGPARRAQLRRLRARGHALPRAGVLGQPADRDRRPDRQGRGAHLDYRRSPRPGSTRSARSG
jgi:cyclopropane-fatty-acyl-phospholipid synthase